MNSNTFQAHIRELPEKERSAFFRGIIAVAEAGRQAGVPADGLAKTYADTYKYVNTMLKARDQ